MMMMNDACLLTCYRCCWY